MLNRKTIGLVGAAFALACMAAEPVMAQTRQGGGGRAPGSRPSGERVLPGRVGGDQTDRREQRQRRERNQPAAAAAATPEQILAAAQAQVAAAGVDCQVTEAVNPGLVGENQVYEAACANAPGYILIASTPPQAFNCLELAGTAYTTRLRDPAADVGQQCILPANQNGLTLISGWAREAGVTCTVDEAIAVGKSDDNNIVYEVGCAGEDGYWLEKADGAWKLQDCLQIASVGGECRFTTAAEQNTTLQTKLAGTEAAGCTVQQVRLMGSNANGRFFEVKCSTDGEGYIARVKDGATQQIYPCATAQNIGGGCTLTAAPAAPTSEQ